nr:MAG TPA: hypothetical protein [Bacteriophage sp.]
MFSINNHLHLNDIIIHIIWYVNQNDDENFELFS